MENIDEQEIASYLEGLIAEYPVCEYAYGSPGDIMFSNKVFTVCETDCERYKHSWACPPYAGSVEDNIERIGRYRQFLVFSTVWDVSDAWDFKACLSVRKQHEEITREVRVRVLEHYGLVEESLDDNPQPPIYFLSAGCSICDECCCPDEPCRHPEQRLMTMESHGILVVNLIEKLGLTASYDGKTVVYFTMVLY